MIERLKQGQMRSKALELGLFTQAELDAMVDAWEQWRHQQDASMGLSNGELIIHKP
jgi:DNA-binding transcriptional regulator of glucitol operon